jgi:ATP-dependent Clp protease protease subunit
MISFDITTHTEGSKLAGYNKRNHFYIGEFDSGLEEILPALSLEIEKQAGEKDGNLDLYINSYGGNADVANHFVSLIEIAKNHGITVRTVVTSAAFSAGSWVAVTGTPGERYISKHAAHLVHYGTIGSASGTPMQHDRAAEFAKMWFKQTISHYNEYSNIPNLAEEIKDDGFYIPAVKAIKWGMADKYLDKFALV